MDDKEMTAVALPSFAPTAGSESNFSVPKPPHLQEVASSSHETFAQSFISPRKKSSKILNRGLNQGLSWVAEPLWVRERKARHDRKQLQVMSTKSPGSVKSSTPSTQTPRYSHKSLIAPPTGLQPLIWLHMPCTTSIGYIGNTASNDLWWAQISNSLASLSARSYHLHVASGFLKCLSEELLLLYEAQRLNIDGKRVYDEVIRGLRERRLNWSFLRGSDGIVELRISWQMVEKREELEEFGVYLTKRVQRLEREICLYAGSDFGDDAETLVNDPVKYAGSSEEESMSCISSPEKFPPAETVVFAAEDNTSPTSPEMKNSIVKKKSSNSSSSICPVSTTVESNVFESPLLSWADEVIEANEVGSLSLDSYHDDIEAEMKEIQSNVDSTASNSAIESLTPISSSIPGMPVPEIVTDVPESSPGKASPQTWAKVAAIPTKLRAITNG